MLEVFRFSEIELLAFFMVLIRMSTFVVSWPIFGSESVSPIVKILFSLVLSLMVFPTIEWQTLKTSLGTEALVWLSLREAFIGLSIGFLARFFFFSIRIAGEIISISMGFGGAQMFNPLTESQASAVDQLHVALATLLFLALNGHHLLLSGVVDSYRIIPLGESLIAVKGLADAGAVLQSVTEMGLKMAAPVMVAVLFMNLTMAVIGRAVPQINVLITSLSVNVLVGLAVMLVGVPLLVAQMSGLAEVTAEELFRLLKTF